MANYPTTAATPITFNDARAATPARHAADHQAHDDEIVAVTIDLVAARGVLASLALRLAAIDTAITTGDATNASAITTGDGLRLLKTANLSDLANLSTALTNLGLNNVTNTSDAGKPVSTAQQTALDLKANLASPTFTGTVAGITKSMVGLSNVDNTSNATERAATATLTNKTLTSPVINTPTGIVKGDVGLGSVDNTTDAGKPVSSAQATAIALKLAIASDLSDVNSAPTSRYNVHVGVLQSAQVVATTNIASLTGTAPSIDGIVAAAGDIVLLTAQSTGAQNGPWLVAAGAWTRPLDYPTTGTVRGRIIEVNQGTTYHGSLWVLKTATVVTIDTTATTWEMAGSAQYAPIGSVPTGAVRGEEYTIGDNSSATLTVPHGLTTLYPQCEVIEIATGQEVECDITRGSSGSVAVYANGYVATTGQWRITLEGL